MKKVNIVQETSNEKTLKVLLHLKGIMEQVKQYKAIHKLKEVLENDTLLSGFSIEPKYGYFDFNVWVRGASYGVRNYFSIKEKSIQSIIEGLDLEIEKVKGWVASQDTDIRGIYYELDRALEKNFSDKEFTLTTFQNTKAEILKELARAIEAVKNFGPDSDLQHAFDSIKGDRE
jgi:hypothetical protein